MEEFIIGVLSGVLAKPVDSIAQELKDGEGKWKPQSELKTYIENAIKGKIADGEKKGREDGHKRAQKEVLEATEARLAKKYSIDEFNGIDDLVSKAIESASGQPPTLDPTSIRESETYKNDLKKLHDKLEKVTGEYDTYKNIQTTREIRSEVRKLAISLIEKEKFALSKNPEIRETHLETYVDALMAKSDWVKNATGELIPVQKGTNEPHKDDMLNNLGAEAFGVSLASKYFEKETTLPPTPGGETVPPGGAGGAGGASKYGVTSVADYYQKEATLKTIEEKKALYNEYQEAIKNGVIKLQ